MSLETIRSAIITVMRTVPAIGVIHPYQRYAKDSATLAKHYVARIDGKDQLRGWYVSRLARINRRKGSGGPDIYTEWLIRGYMALADAEASELQFDTLLEGLMDAFWLNQNLGGAVILTATGTDAALNLQEAGPVLFAGVLCHSARLTLRTLHNER